MKNDLVGVWQSDANDIATLQNYGNVIMDFRENGDLIYTVVEQDKEQKIFMTYEISENFLITDQASSPQKTQTEFFIDRENKVLELISDGIRSKYLKIRDVSSA